VTAAGRDAAVLVDVPGGVCAVSGIRAAGIAAGLKPSGTPDLALVAADRTVVAAAVQTTNQVTAMPVRVTARHVADGRARAVLLNAGNANVCTGSDGLAVAQESAAAAAAALECAATDILVCSTGVIGVPLAREPFLSAIPLVASALSPDGGASAARAIMTTDTVAKQAAVRLTDGEARCVVGGMAKGSGMIAPEMATMLCVLTTDAAVPGTELSPLLAEVVAETFGRISVDGCQSTNDAVVLLATGEAAVGAASLRRALTAVCAELAEQLVRDGEGAERVVHVTVGGARSEADALGVARAIAGSALVRTAIAGGDPNWGRVLAAMGAGPVLFDPDRVEVAFGSTTVCRRGTVAEFDRLKAAAELDGTDVVLRVDLGLGSAEATVLTCDLTHDYIRINAEYTT